MSTYMAGHYMAGNGLPCNYLPGQYMAGVPPIADTFNAGFAAGSLEKTIRKGDGTGIYMILSEILRCRYLHTTLQQPEYPSQPQHFPFVQRGFHNRSGKCMKILSPILPASLFLLSPPLCFQGKPIGNSHSWVSKARF